MTKYQLKELKNGHLVLTTERYEYDLHYQEMSRSGSKFYFRIPIHDMVVTVNGHDLHPGYGLDPSRQQAAYLSEVVKIAASPRRSFQYVEIGAGLGEFIPTIARFSLKKRPIVIDPANYELMLEMFGQMEKYVELPSDQDELDKLVRRAKIICDSSKVHLVNSTLGTALREHPELRGIGDVVIECYGPGYWHTESTEPQDINGLEQQLVKAGGTLYNRLFRWDGAEVGAEQ